jgi:hypothetical protein
VSPSTPAGRNGARLLLVHAHPDDETLATGATLARYAAEGARVTLVTCTLGEQGEVIPPELRHLESTDALGPLRARELASAMAELGVRDHRLLAGGRWRDSGMAWLAPGIAGSGSSPPHPDAFVQADVDEAAAELARRYLAGYGPAGPSDFSAWSGLGAGVARRAWAAIGDEITQVETDRGPASVLAREPPVRAGKPAPLRLVGGFDGLLLGYADRDLHVDPQHARRVNAGGGMVRPVVIVDGRAIGTWAYRRGRATPQIDVVPFRPLSGRERAELEREAADVGRFLGSAPALTVTPA